MDTLHMKLQIIGKVRLALTRREPQWANVPLYLTARGLTTSPIWSGGAGLAVGVDPLHPPGIVGGHDRRLQRVAPTARPVGAFFYAIMGGPPPRGNSPPITHVAPEVWNP